MLPGTIKKYQLLLISILAGLAFWVVDSALDALFFYPQVTFSQLLIMPPPHEMYVRLTVLAILTLFGAVINWQYQRNQSIWQNYSTVLENFPDGAVLLYDHDLTYLVAEGSGLTQTGLSGAEMVGKAIQEVFPPETVELIKPAYQAALEGQTKTTTVPFQDKVFRMKTLPIRDPSGSISSGLVMTQDITREIEQEIAFLESERRFRDIFETVNLAAVILDLEGNISHCNQYLLEITGYQRDEVIGSSWFENFVPPEYKDQLKESVFLESVRTGSAKTHHINPILTREGERRIISWSNIIFRDLEGNIQGTASLGADITEREAFRRELENIFQMSSDLICVADLETFTFVHINPSFERVLGYPEEELLQSQFLDFVHPDDQDSTVAIVEEKLRLGEKVISFTNRYRCADGSYRWLDWISHPTPEDGMTYAIARDITEKRRTESELHKYRSHLEELVEERTGELLETNLQLRKTGEALQAALVDMEAFMYSVSHDLRAPLRGISGFSHILASRHREALDEQGQEYLDFVVQASTRMGQLIDDLLGYARLGRKAIRHERVEIPDLLRDVESDLNAKLQESGGKITLENQPPEFYSDPALLKQILHNLLDNALTYHRPGDPPQIKISCQFEEANILISISDNGIGIPEEHQDKVFNIFQRLHSEEDYPGTGIGLALVRKAAALLDGEVLLQSKPGEGSQFSIRIPLDEKDGRHET
jgi:PAS domain S-box-containing protein